MDINDFLSRVKNICRDADSCDMLDGLMARPLRSLSNEALTEQTADQVLRARPQDMLRLYEADATNEQGGSLILTRLHRTAVPPLSMLAEMVTTRLLEVPLPLTTLHTLLLLEPEIAFTKFGSFGQTMVLRAMHRRPTRENLDHLALILQTCMSRCPGAIPPPYGCSLAGIQLFDRLGIPYDRENLLQLASFQANFRLVFALLFQSANPNNPGHHTRGPWYALHAAVEHSSEPRTPTWQAATIVILLAHGADPSLPNVLGESVVDVVGHQGAAWIVELVRQWDSQDWFRGVQDDSRRRRVKLLVARARSELQHD